MMRLFSVFAVLTILAAPAAFAQQGQPLRPSLFVAGGTELAGFRDGTKLIWPWTIQMGAILGRPNARVAFRISATYMERNDRTLFHSAGVLAEVLRQLGAGRTNAYVSGGAGVFRAQLISEVQRPGHSVKTEVERTITPAVSVGFGVARHVGRGTGTLFLELRYTQYLLGRRVTPLVLPLTLGFRL